MKGWALIIGTYSQLIVDMLIINDFKLIYVAKQKDAINAFENHDFKAIICDEKSWEDQDLGSEAFLKMVTEKFPDVKLVVISRDKDQKLNSHAIFLGPPEANMRALEDALETYE